jgi:hypothetical protein
MWLVIKKCVKKTNLKKIAYGPKHIVWAQSHTPPGVRMGNGVKYNKSQPEVG